MQQGAMKSIALAAIVTAIAGCATQGGVSRSSVNTTIRIEHGTVTGVEDETVLLEVAPGVQTRYARPAIARVVKRVEVPEAETISEEEAESVKE